MEKVSSLEILNVVLYFISFILSSTGTCKTVVKQDFKFLRVYTLIKKSVICMLLKTNFYKML